MLRCCNHRTERYLAHAFLWFISIRHLKYVIILTFTKRRGLQLLKGTNGRTSVPGNSRTTLRLSSRRVRCLQLTSRDDIYCQNDRQLLPERLPTFETRYWCASSKRVCLYECMGECFWHRLVNNLRSCIPRLLNAAHHNWSAQVNSTYWLCTYNYCITILFVIGALAIRHFVSHATILIDNFNRPSQTFHVYFSFREHKACGVILVLYSPVV